MAAFQCGSAGVDAGLTELCSSEVRLLEVVADELVLARQLSAGPRLEPGSEPQMEIGAQILRHRRVGDVADEHMVEAEAVVALEEGAVRSKQLLARQSEEDAAQPVRALRRKELRDR